MSQINHRERWKNAFQVVIDSYQHLKSSNGHVGALDYERAALGVGSGVCKRVVRPNISDFLCDVELKSKKALTGDKEALAFYIKHYEWNLYAEVPKGELNDRVMERVGRMFLAVGIYPLAVYFAPKDCR